MTTQANSQPALQSLINQGPRWLDAHLRQFEKRKDKLSINQMLGIFEGAAGRSRLEDDLEWAGIAVRAAELYALGECGKHREHALRKAMQFRAAFIVRMGSRSGHPVLDKEIILRWVTEGISMPIIEAKALSARLKHGQWPLCEHLDELRELHRIRARIGVARTLVDCGELESGSWIDEWIKMELLNEIP
jgi:hypothetical protein